MSGSCPATADNTFGPIIRGCNHADFTLLFEQSVLSIGPSALLLCVAPLRAFGLRNKPTKILRHRGLFSKLSTLVLLSGIELALLVLWSVKPRISTDASVAATVLSFISTIALVALSYAEHTRCVQPSAIINVYLASSLMLDIPQARTLFSRDSAPASISALFVCSMTCKGFALLLEAQNKKRYLRAPYSGYSPEALSSIINRSFQWWVNPLFIRGFRQLLSVDQLFPPDHELSSEKLCLAQSKIWPQANSKSKSHPLRRSLWVQLKTQVAATMVPRVLLIGFKFCQPLLINQVTSVLSSGEHEASYNNFLIPAAALIYGGLAVCTSLYRVQMSRTKAMTRGILVSSIFGKTIGTSNTGNKAPLSLMTNDSVRFTTYIERVIDGMAGSAIEIAVALVLLAREIGWVCIVPIVLSALASAWGFWNTGAAAPLQRAWVAASQERVTFTAKTLGFPKALKMLGLTEIFREQIQKLRYNETELSKPVTRFTVWRNTIGHGPGIWAPPATLAIAVLVEGNGYLTVQKAFTTLSIIALLTSPVENLVQSVPMVGSATALLDRIEEFLVKDQEPVHTTTPLRDNRSDTELQALTRHLSTHKDAVVKTVEASFGYDTDKTILENISINIVQNTLSIIYGPVGCGKSTLLHAIIGDVKAATGFVVNSVKETSYCAQETWLPNLSIRNIITMESEADANWYNTVVEACGLVPDIRRMPEGDDTLVGSKGVQLSGGQRQRTALARAIYSRNKLVVADDILSGLDATTSSKVFDQIFGPFGLCKKHNITAVLATHNKNFASRADYIIMLGPNRTIITQGPYDVVNEHLQAAVLASNSPEGAEDDTKEAKTKTRVEIIESDIEKDLKRKTGDLSLYAYYAKNIGLVRSILFIVPACIFIFCLSFPSVWLKWWAQDASQDTHKNAMYIGVYFALSFAASTLGALAMLQFTTVISPRCGRNLHRYLLDAVLNAPYSFFASIDTGVILNRFSQDMVMIDANLASAAFMASMFALQAMMEGGLIVSGSVYITATIPAVLAVLYAIQYIYLRTSRQLRFLDLEAQAPLQTHFLETIDGLATIRAFGWQERARQKNWRLLDFSQRPFYLLLCAQVWLALVLDLVVAGIAVLVVAVALNTDRNTSAGSVGVSLFGVLTFSATLTDLIKSWTGLETSLGAVARVKDFETTMASEDAGVTNAFQTPQEWPAGRVDFNNAVARYNTESEPVLADFDLHIKAGEKVGICGRSGSGKSSVLLSLFRMLEVSSGSIELDTVDIKTLHSQVLRSHLNVVPQEPVLLPGSLRFNIDPSGKSKDDEIVNVLEKVSLWSVLQGRDGGLDAPLEASSLSLGQQQLVSVARAMLKHTKVLVLDEATSSVDSVTEQRIMEIIKDEFKNSTIIAVAHRLKTLRNFDRIVVMDRGRIAEIGSPEELLNKESTFQSMYERSS